MSSYSIYIKLALLLFIFLTTDFFLSDQSSSAKPMTLRENYVRALKSFKGASYAPAGDSNGISCSTFVRKALIETVGTDQAMRSSLESHPCLSDDLRKGCDNQLSFVIKAQNFNSLNYDKIQLGDIAVLGNKIGIHTMAYIGNKTWIHSDPVAEEVIESIEPEDYDDWDTFEVNIWRWNVLKDN